MVGYIVEKVRAKEVLNIFEAHGLIDFVQLQTLNGKVIIEFATEIKEVSMLVRNIFHSQA
jgi:hypothetical protein